MRHRLALVVAVVLVAGGLALPASAQTAVLNPKTVEFSPSVDHDALEADGTTPVVTKYELRMYVESDPATAISTTDLGKPTPVAGTISITNPLWFAALTPRTRYVAKVAAIGTGGAGVSGPSDPFGLTSPPAAVPPPVVR